MKKQKLYFFAFLIPVSIMLIIFAIQQIYPFGERSFLHIDMYHQYFPFLVEFYHKIKNGESLLYSWNTGIGSNFLALYVYYLASPTNWLCLLFPESALMEFISYMVIIKIGLCSVTFTYYIKKHFQTSDYSILLFSLFYALSGYMAAYNWNVMWLDCIIIAPVIILGLEKLVQEGNCHLYCISLGMSILTNYYLSIMICIFLVLYFLVLLICKNPHDTKQSKPISLPVLCHINNDYAKAILRFGVYSLLAGGMAAILLIPELAALRFTEFSSISFPKSVKTYFPILDMLARHSFNVTVETGLDHWPNIYCGVAVFLLLPLYIMQHDIPIREKAPKLILLFFILISFSTNVLNFIWHGLNYPDSLPARQSFLYIFLLLVLCYEAFLHIQNHTGNEIMGLFLCVIFFMLFCEKLVTDDAFSGAGFLLTGIFLICYAGMIHMYRTNIPLKKYIAFFTFVLVIFEAGMNTYLTSVPTVSRTTYWSNYDSYQTLVERTKEKEDNDFFRFDKFSRRTQNDAMFVGFQSATCFSSTSNTLVKDFYKKYGMKSSRVYYCFDGATPFTAALLANRYMLYTADIGESDIFELVDTEGNLYLYKNKYSLPLGFMVSAEMVSTSDMESITAHHNALSEDTAAIQTSPVLSDDEILEDLFTNAEEVAENLHENDKTDNLNPIERQNRLVSQLGFDGTAFVYTPIEQMNDFATLEIAETGHYYAYTKNTAIDNINVSCDGLSDKKIKSIKKKFILDLGYFSAGSTVSLSSENGEELGLSVYKLNQEVLDDFIDGLSAQTMTVDSYTDTTLDGHIYVEDAGELVLSIPYEPGWTVLVDGQEADIDLFEDTMISVYLTKGAHTISLSYYPEGFRIGIVISLLSLFVFAILFYRNQSVRQPVKN